MRYFATYLIYIAVIAACHWLEPGNRANPNYDLDFAGSIWDNTYLRTGADPPLSLIPASVYNSSVGAGD